MSNMTPSPSLLDQGSSVEESDQLCWSVKKPKCDAPSQSLNAAPIPGDVSMEVENTWTGGSFVDAVRGPGRKVLYTGEDEEDSLDDLTLADVFQIPDAGGDLASCPFVDLNWDRYKAHWLPWRRALILKPLGKNFHFKVIEPRLKRVWKLQEDCEVIDIDNDYFIACFYSREDYLKALQEGPWMVLGHYFMIHCWKPNFVPTADLPHKTLVWIWLPHVPVEMFYEEALLDMGNVVGRAVQIECMGTDVVKGRFARVCVEMDLRKPLVPVINIMGRRQDVEYEGLYWVCYSCG